MSNLFDILGFTAATPDDIQELARHTYQQGDALEHEQGLAFLLDVGHGIELWGQLNKDNHFVGLNPHFSGHSSIQMGLTHRLIDGSSLDTALHAWVGATTDPEDGLYPVLFQGSDALLHPEQDLLGIRQVQVTAFAPEVKVFADQAAYDRSQGDGPAFAAESFIPTGLFGGDGQPYGMFTGTVLQVQTVTNPMTGRSFCHAVVQTLGGAYDAVFPVQEPPVQPGNILQGNFLLSGKVLQPQVN